MQAKEISIQGPNRELYCAYEQYVGVPIDFDKELAVLGNKVISNIMIMMTTTMMVMRTTNASTW